MTRPNCWKITSHEVAFLEEITLREVIFPGKITLHEVKFRITG